MKISPAPRRGLGLEAHSPARPGPRLGSADIGRSDPDDASFIRLEPASGRQFVIHSHYRYVILQ